MRLQSSMWFQMPVLRAISIELTEILDISAHKHKINNKTKKRKQKQHTAAVKRQLETTNKDKTISSLRE